MAVEKEVQPRTLRCYIISTSKEIKEEITDFIRQEYQIDYVAISRVDEGLSLMKSINNMIKESDFIIAIITKPTPNIYYELGYAQGLGKPTLVFTTEYGYTPGFENLIFTTLFEDNIESVKFSLAQFIKNFKPKSKKQGMQKTKKTKRKLSQKYKNKIQNMSKKGMRSDIEEIILELMNDIGLIYQYQPRLSETKERPDMSLWIDTPDEIFAKPIIVEVKYGNLTDNKLSDTEYRLHNWLNVTKSNIAILIYLDKNLKKFPNKYVIHPNILRFELIDLIQKLDHMTLDEIIQEERNKLAHNGGW